MRCLFLFYSFLLLLISCKKEIEKDSFKEEPTTRLEVIWKNSLHEDSSLTVSVKPIFFSDKVIFSNVWRSGSDQIIQFDAISGERLGVWRDYVIPTEFLSNENLSFKYPNLIISSGYTFVSLNCETMQTNWKYEFPDGEGLSFHYLDNDEILTSVEYDGFKPNARAAILRSSILNPDFDTLHVEEIENEYAPRLVSICRVFRPNGDTLLVFKNHRYNFSKLSYYTEVVCKNLNNDSIVWSFENHDNNDGINPILPFSDYLLIPCGSRLLFVDILSGNVVWEYDHQGFGDQVLFGNGGIVINENWVFVRSEDEVITALNMIDGTVNWVRKNSGYFSENEKITFNKGKLFYCAEGYFWVLDAFSGEILIKERSPRPFAGYQGTPTVDPSRNVVYLNDGKFAYCLKLPDFN